MTALLSPWTWLAIAGVIIAALGGGVVREHDLRITFIAQVEALGKAEEAHRIKQVKAQQALTKESNDAWYRRLARTKASAAGNLAGLERMLNDPDRDPFSSISRAPSGGAGLPEGAICYDRARLASGIRAALSTFATGLGPSVERGAIAADSFAACADWAIQQRALSEALR